MSENPAQNSVVPDIRSGIATSRLTNPNSDDPLIRARGICMYKNCDVRKIIKEMKDCQTRIANKPYTAETCQQEMTDLVMAVDHCVGHKAFDALK